MFCIHCGGQLPDGARFCPSCGKKVAGHCLGRLGDMEGALKYFRLAKEHGYSQSALAPYCRELGLDPDRV